MASLSVKGYLILSGAGNRNSVAYRGIMALLARFGYCSIREIMYDLELSMQVAINRLWYLEKGGLIKGFPSQTVPTEFYSLTADGRQAVRDFQISDESIPFSANQYKLLFQLHHRLLVQTYSALKKVLGESFLGWISERQLKLEGSGKGKRILDGEFLFRVERELVAKKDHTLVGQSKDSEDWRGGIELELSLKAPKRYEIQFEQLAKEVRGSEGRSPTKTVLFLCGSEGIRDRLLKYAIEFKGAFLGVTFYLGLVDEFIKTPSRCVLVKIVAGQSKEIPAYELNQVKVLVGEKQQ